MPPMPTKLIGIAILIFVLIVASSQMTYVVPPGYRGIEVTLGKVSPIFKSEGFGTKIPFITHIIPINIRQATRGMKADCFSSDLQQVTIELQVLYRIPQESVVRIYQQYAGDPFDSLIAPRIQEATKEASASQSAEQIVKNREEIKTKTLASSRTKVGDILMIEDIVIQNISLSHELEAAIEQKMVQEQEAAKSKFIQQKAEIEANTAIIRAKGEAEAIRIRALAIKDNPGLIQLQIVEKWDGKTPLVVGGQGNGSGTSILLPLDDIQKIRR